jgi:hypothetical protein
MIQQWKLRNGDKVTLERTDLGYRDIDACRILWNTDGNHASDPNLDLVERRRGAEPW